MDSELKAILESMQASLRSMNSRFDAVDKRFDAVDQRFEAVDRRFDAMENLIVDVKESLEREIGEVRGRLDVQDARLARQGALLQSGGRLLTRNAEWAESVDATLSANQKEIAELKERLSRLEKKSA